MINILAATLAAQIAAVPVKSVTGLYTAVGIWTAIIGGTVTVLVAALRWIPKWIENRRLADDSLRADLLQRVETLEKDIKEERGARELERARYEAERTRHEAQMALMRHRLNNSDQSLDALLMLLETSPNKVASAVGLIKDMRHRQRTEEAVEKAALHGAEIAVKDSLVNGVTS